MEKQPHQHFTELEVREKTRELHKEIKNLAKTFPAEEGYRLIDQIIRSVRSINANIAEGYGRFTFKDQLHFCIQARGSICETEDHLIDTFDCAYILLEQLTYFKSNQMKLGAT